MPNNGHGQEDAPGKNKEYSIIINGRPMVVTEHKLTYDQILSLAKIPAGGQTTLYIITFERGPSEKSEGTISTGDSVVVKDGMVFNVSTTNKS